MTEIKAARLKAARPDGMKQDSQPDERLQFAESDSRHHTLKLHGMLDDVIRHAREDVGKVEDPKAKALFETTAEVLGGLVKAYEHAEARSEAAWR